jgi:hypothetical protein
MIAAKPHEATIYSVSTTVASNIAGQVTRTVGSTLRGQLTRKTPQYIYDTFGVETSQPALFLADTSGGLKSGDHVSIGGVFYEVKARPSLRDAQTLTSHYVIVLDEVNQI